MDLQRRLINHLFIPATISLLLAVSYYFMIYNRSGADLLLHFKEPLFLWFALLGPLFLTCLVSLKISDKAMVGAAAGIFLVLLSWIGTMLQVTPSWGYTLTQSPQPVYYQEFIQSGSFHLIFFFLGVFIVIGGYGLGFLSKIADPKSERDKSIGAISKAQRRSKKKRKKALVNKKKDFEKIVDELFDDSEESMDEDPEK
jgi:hypothetical protein